MRTYILNHASDHDVSCELSAFVARDRTNTAGLLAYLAEFDERRLYVPASYPSMLAYCVHELHMPEASALKRIRVARMARRFPIIFDAIADGRLHLSAVVLLKPHLNSENSGELLEAAAHQTRSAIEQLLALRFPSSEMLPLVEPLPGSRPPDDEVSPGTVEEFAENVRAGGGGSTDPLSPGTVATAVPRTKVKPHAAGRFALQLTMSQATYDKLQHAQALLSHAIPSGDIAEVLDRALDALIAKLEKRKFAATSKPRQPQRSTSANPRYVPAHVKHAVWERDGGQCTFVSESGQRCPACTLLEFDHIDEVARGGCSTVENIRLRCRAHNQYEAERTFGAGFMSDKREEARAASEARKAAKLHAAAEAVELRAVAKARDAAEARDAVEARTTAKAKAKAAADEVIPWLRQLRFRPDEARRAAALCENIPDASLEQRMRLALTYFHAPRVTPTQLPAGAS